jgi:hypothetical protein
MIEGLFKVPVLITDNTITITLYNEASGIVLFYCEMIFILNSKKNMLTCLLRVKIVKINRNR